ncbi:hypothetical protein AAZX31_19G091800 [Glycine max]
MHVEYKPCDSFNRESTDAVRLPYPIIRCIQLSIYLCVISPALESIVVVGVLANPTFHFGQRLWRRSDEALYGGMYVYYI